ncbi:Cna B-type domain-containing protein [Virgibacillus oceani]
MIGELEDTLVLHYTTAVTATDGNISNRISLDGIGIDRQTQESSQLSARQFSDAGGEWARDRGALSVTKEDSDTGEIITNDTTFTLWYELNGERVQYTQEESFTTDEGILQIGNLPLRTYYLVEEEAPPGYVLSEEELELVVDTAYDNNEENIVSDTFENTKEKTDVTGTKVWEGGETVRPDSIELQPYRDGGAYESVKLESGETEYTWTDLDVTDIDGNEYVYTVDEVEVPDHFEKTISEDGLTITNEYIVEQVSVTVNKIWDDADNQDGIRPESIIVKLLADGEETDQELTLDEDNNWAGSFNRLPATDRAGNEVSYTIEELAVNGYESEVETDEDDPYNFNLTNTHEPEKIDITGTKVWDDADNQDGNRPSSIKVQLEANDEQHGEPITLQGPDWSYTWTELDVYANGEPVEYTIAELGVPEGYEVNVNNDDQENIVITNSYEPETTEIAINKVWDDADNQDGVRPNNVTVNLLGNEEVVSTTVLDEENEWQHTFIDLPVYENGNEINYRVTENTVIDYQPTIEFTGTEEEPAYTITNSYTPEETSVTVTKSWDDDSDRDGNRPETIEVQLLADGEDYGDPVTLDQSDWSHTWDELDANANGEPIEYTVEEVNVPEGYEVSVDDTDHGNIIITNSYEPETTERTVRKAWDDAENQDGVRPTNVEVNLVGNGEVVSTTVLGDENDWQHTFSNLPVNENGEEINYRVTENTVADYSPSIDPDPNNETGFVITNSYTPEETSATVTKAWNDGNNQDGNRPESIQVQLYGNGTEVDEPVDVTAADEWTYTWSGLDAYAEGEAIAYTVEELNVPEEYSVTVNNNDHGNLIITNNYTPEVTEIPVTKIWDDGEDRDRVRPNNVTVTLLADGRIVEGAILNEARDWEHTFTNLPVYENGTEINYSVTENTFPEYSTFIEADEENENGFVITNSYTPEETTATVTKSWNDADNQDGIRPEAIEVQLLANGEATGDPVEITADAEWKYIWDGLPLNAEGEPITYSVEELNVPEGYETSVNDEDHGNLLLTNSYTPEEIVVSGMKTWDDADNQDGIRPESITVNLLANGEIIDSEEVTQVTDWNYSFENLPKYEAGEEITYTITEAAIEGYETEIDGFNITNTHTPEEIDISGTKTWDDSDNQDGIRSDIITVNLLADGKQVDSVEVTGENGWTYNFTDLPKYEAGEEITYTVTENTVENYTQTIEGFDITNQYTPGQTAVTVTKNWDDANNQDGIRPENIEVQLTADGENHGDPVELSEANNWTHTWTELDEKAAGETIDYSVVELTEVPKYETTVNDADHGNIIITNAYTPEEIEISGTKTWEDVDNEDYTRPESITVNILANGEVVHSIKVTEADDWNYSFTNLPKYKAGKEIDYSISEDAVEGYESTVEGYDITNTLIPEEEATTPGPTDKPSDSQKDDVTEVSITGDEAGTGDRMPDTATNIYNILLIGMALLAIGFALMMIYRKRKAV